MIKFCGNKQNSLFVSTVICMIVGIITRELYLLENIVPVRDSYKYFDFISEWNSFSQSISIGKYPPLALFILKIPSSYFSYDIINGSILVNNVLGIAIIMLITIITYQLTKNNWITISIGLIFGTHPTLVKYSCEAIRENTYILFLCLSIWGLLAHIKRKKTLYLLLTSFFTCCGTLCRHEGLEAFVTILIILLAFENNKSFIKRFVNICVYSAGYVLSFFVVIRSIGIPFTYFYGYQYILESLSI